MVAGVSAGAATIVIRGVPADPDTFSLTTLQDPRARALVENARQRAFDACMVEKGFPSPPKTGQSDYAKAYAMAAAGDDVSSTTPPPTRRVKIAAGISGEVSVSWTRRHVSTSLMLNLGWIHWSATPSAGG